jgi:hypothetical protein
MRLGGYHRVDRQRQKPARALPNHQDSGRQPNYDRFYGS